MSLTLFSVDISADLLHHIVLLCASPVTRERMLQASTAPPTPPPSPPSPPCSPPASEAGDGVVDIAELGAAATAADAVPPPEQDGGTPPFEQSAATDIVDDLPIEEVQDKLLLSALTLEAMYLQPIPMEPQGTCRAYTLSITKELQPIWSSTTAFRCPDGVLGVKTTDEKHEQLIQAVHGLCTAAYLHDEGPMSVEDVSNIDLFDPEGLHIERVGNMYQPTEIR